MNRFKILLYSFTAILSIVLIVYGCNVFPVPGTDSIVFIPPALLFSKGYGLANPLYYITEFTDPTHTGRYNYYVPFYSWLLGMLSQERPGVKTIFAFCSLFSAINLLLYARTILSFLTEGISKWLRVLALLSVIYVATYLLPTVGRPENLMSLLVFLVYILYSKRKSCNPALYNILACILFSLILATQMICFYFCFLFFITSELLNTENVYRAVGVNTLRVIAILAGFCIILACSPNGFMNTVTGIQLHASAVFGRSDRSLKLFFHYWFLSPLNIGFLVVFVLAAVCYGKDLYSRLKNSQRIQLMLTVIVQVLILYGIIKFILYASPTVYNATQFILPLTAYLVLNIVLSARERTNRYMMPLTLLTCVAGCLVFFRSLVLFIDYKSGGKDYGHAAPLINSIAKNYPRVYITNSLWSLFDNFSNVKIYYGINIKKDDVIIVQEINHPFPKELVNKCTIIYDWRTKGNNEFSGLKLSNRPQGFGFVVCRIN